MDTEKKKQTTDTGVSSAAGADKDEKLKKITLTKPGKTQVVINPPEKIDPQRGQNEAFKQAINKHTVVLETKIALVLQSKATNAGLPEETIQKVFVRGYKNLPLNTELTREQYAMNRVNSFIAGGAAMVEDYDLIPIDERLHTTMGTKGTGGGMRPHIKREKNVYNGKTTFHVVDAKGTVKHSTNDEIEAKKHLASKYQSYMEAYLNKPIRHSAGGKLVSAYQQLNRKVPDGQKHTPKQGQDVYRMKGNVKEDINATFDKLVNEGDGLWANIHAKRERIKHGSGEHMRKPGSKGAPTSADLKRSAVKEDAEQVTEISKELANRYYYASKSAGDQIDAKVNDHVKKLRDKWTQNRHNKITDLLAKSQKRTSGRLRAMDRLAKEETEVAEGTSAAIRMQRALEKIKADRERKERLAAPYVNSVFAKKVEDKKKDVKEGLADDIIAAAKARGINAKIAPPLEDRKKATVKLLKHRAKERARNPAPPRPAPPQKTGFGSGAIDDTKGT